MSKQTNADYDQLMANIMVMLDNLEYRIDKMIKKIEEAQNA